MFPEMGARMVEAINQRAKQRWQTDRKDVFYTQRKSLPTFKKTHPIIVDKQSITYTKKSAGYIFTTTLLSRNGEGVKRCGLILNTKNISATQRSLLKGIFSGEILSKSALLGCNERKRKWYVSIAYEPQKSPVLLEPDRVVGVNLGFRNAFFCSVSGSVQKMYVGGSEIEKFRRTIQKRRTSLQNLLKVSGRGGHGRNKLFEPLKALSDKESRFRDTRYHIYTKAIVDFAVKNNAGTIQIENLDSINESKHESYILKDWSIDDFHTKIKYKASEYGVNVIKVKPQYINQRCSQCGHIEIANRPPSHPKFECTNCGFRADADYNAAMNLSVKGLEEIISRWIETNWLTYYTREAQAN